MDNWHAWLGYPLVEYFNGLNISDLPLNFAYVIANTSLDNAAVYTVSDACIGCPYTLEKLLPRNQEVVWKFDASLPSTWRVMNSGDVLNLPRNNRSGLLCQTKPDIGEFGVYRLDIGACQLYAELEPINIYLPLLLIFLLLIGAGLLFNLAKYVTKWVKRQHIVDDDDETKKADDDSSKCDEEELKSLFVFRGLLLSLIIFLNAGGGGYSIFMRDWGGISLADCILFSFVWTIGVNVPRTVDMAFEDGFSKCRIFGNICKRSFVLIFLGTLIDSAIREQSALVTIPFWCPLQRMGAAYFVAATAYTLTVQRFDMASKNIIYKLIKNIGSLLWCWIIIGFLIGLQVISFSTFVSFNCQSSIGLETPTADPSNIYKLLNSCNSDVTEIANGIFMADPKKVLYVNTYYGFTKGLMGILTTIIQCMLGLKAGTIYHHYSSHGDRIKLWYVWTIVFASLGVIVAGLSMPLQINLWPLATIILTSAISIFALSTIYILVKVIKLSLEILRTAGKTSLLIFSGHLLFSKFPPFHWEMAYKCHFAFIVQDLWCAVLWLAIGWFVRNKFKCSL